MPMPAHELKRLKSDFEAKLAHGITLRSFYEDGSGYLHIEAKLPGVVIPHHVHLDPRDFWETWDMLPDYTEHRTDAFYMRFTLLMISFQQNWRGVAWEINRIMSAEKQRRIDIVKGGE